MDFYQSDIGSYIIYFKGSQAEFPNFGAFLSLKIVLTLANSVDLDGMAYSVAIILVFTVYQSTHLRVIRIKRVNPIPASQLLLYALAIAYF